MNTMRNHKSIIIRLSAVIIITALVFFVFSSSGFINPITIKSQELQGENIYFVNAGDYLNLRTVAYGESEVIRKLQTSERLKFIDFVGSYYMVETIEEEQGYVRAGYVTPLNKDEVLMTNNIVSTNNAIYTYETMMDDLDALAEKYSTIVKLSIIGRSLDDRELPVMVVGSLDADNHVLIHAGIHSREHMTVLLVMKQLEYYLQNYDNYDFSDTCFHILPNVNPDGVAISQKGIDSIKNTELRENLIAIYNDDYDSGRTQLSMDEYFEQYKCNANGVNLNLNYDAMWDMTDSPDSPQLNSYKGRELNSEPETKRLVEYTNMYDFDCTISYHAYGSGIFWDFGQTDKLKQDTILLRDMIQDYNGYIDLDALMDYSYGGYKDWAVSKLGIPSLTIEIGSTPTPLPIREFDTIWERNREVWSIINDWLTKKDM